MEISGDAAYMTEGARGVGREIRIELADHGLTVAMADLNDAPRDEIVRRIEAAGNRTIGVWPDLAEPATVSESVGEVWDAVEGVDVLITTRGSRGRPHRQRTFPPRDGENYPRSEPVRGISVRSQSNGKQ